MYISYILIKVIAQKIWSFIASRKNWLNYKIYRMVVIFEQLKTSLLLYNKNANTNIVWYLYLCTQYVQKVWYIVNTMIIISLSKKLWDKSILDLFSKTYILNKNRNNFFSGKWRIWAFLYRIKCIKEASKKSETSRSDSIRFDVEWQAILSPPCGDFFWKS